MAVANAMDFGPGGGLRFARSTPRSVTGDSLGAIRYPNPFFDIAQTYLPSSFKSMLRWCRYYFLTSPLINAACYKMAEYPVTDLVFDSDNRTVHDQWKTFFSRTLRFKRFLVEIGLDFAVYGNSFVSIHYPFKKYLICRHCEKPTPVTEQEYVFREFHFVGECRRCGHHGEFKVKDEYVRSSKDIRLIRWNPEDITIQHNDATGESTYYYTLPPPLANDIRMGKRLVIEKIPQVFIDALRLNRALLFSQKNIYHLRRPTIAQKDKGWGLPMVLPVLKDSFYLQILRKAQEAISVEHIVPLRILFPQSATTSSDVYSNVSLVKWRNQIEQEILRWRLDNNYIPIMPLPVGQETLGGNGKALLLNQEYRVWAEHIIAGLGVPQEFVMGGLSFSGSNVSLRMLENHFLDQKGDHLALVIDFIMPAVGAFMGWQAIPAHFKRFKMADDLQRSAFYLQLNQAGMLSMRSLLEDTDWDSDREIDRIAAEQQKQLTNQRRQALAQASIQGEAQSTMQKYQLRAQRAAQEMLGAPMDPAVVDQNAAAAQQMSGIPGQASPQAVGQMGLEQTEQTSRLGLAEPAPAEALEGAALQGGDSSGIPSEVQSPLSAVGPRSAVGLQEIAERIVRQLDQLPAHEQVNAIGNIRRSNPQLAVYVVSLLNFRRGAHQSSAGMAAPKVKAPRRGFEATTT